MRLLRPLLVLLFPLVAATQDRIAAQQLPADSVLLQGSAQIDDVIRLNLSNAVLDHLELWRSRAAPRTLLVRYDKLFRFDLTEVQNTLAQWSAAGALIYSLKNDSLLIIYVAPGRRDTAWRHVSAGELTKLEKDLRLAVTTRSFRTASRGIRGSKRPAGDSPDALLLRVSRLLLPEKFPLDSLQHLVLIPTHNIGSFPFACLRFKSHDLIDVLSYSVAPSVTEFIAMGFNSSVEVREDLPYDRERQDMLELLSRPSKYVENDSARWLEHGTVLLAGAPQNEGYLKEKFSPLPGAQAELELAAGKFKKSYVFSGPSATKKQVLGKMRDAQLIYFATHAVADSENPLDKSYVLLSGATDTALLTTREIQQAHLTALLVVLSACETGLGKAHSGGTIGLARAFEIAGARNVLMSLWEISDGRTPELMSLFLRHLVNEGKGQNYFPYEALRQAILEYKKKQPDPYYWAAFSMFGVPI